MKLKFIRKFAVILYCTLIIAVINIQKPIYSYEIHPSPNPKIWLKAYWERDSYEYAPATEFQNVEEFENIFVSKNGSEFVISSETSQVEFACEADYPIKWNLPNVQQFSGVQNFQLRVDIERRSNFDELAQEPQSLKFYAHLKVMDNFIENYDSLSGLLACQMVANPTIQSSIYAYKEGQYPMGNVGMVTYINVSQTSDSVIIPCRPTLPTISISLFKQIQIKNNNEKNSASSIWQPMYLSNSIKFDPRLGFILDKSLLRHILGKYKCVVDGEEDSVFTFYQVALGKEPDTNFTPWKTITSDKSQLKYGRGYVECCTTSSPNASVSGNHYFCDNEAECELLKPVFMHDVSVGRVVSSSGHSTLRRRYIKAPKKDTKEDGVCYRTYMPFQLPHQSQLFLCNGPGIEVVGQFVTGFREPDKNPNPITRIYGNRHQLLDVFDLSWNRNDMKIANKIYFQIEAPLLSGLLTDLGSNFLNYKIPLNKGPYFYHHRRRRPRPLYTPVNRDILYEGESLLVTCLTHSYFYSKGGWLRLNWRNGSKTVFDHMNLNSLLKQHEGSINSLMRLDVLNEALIFGGGGGSHGSDYMLGMIDSVDLEMQSLECFAPVWNSDKWEVRTYPMDIKPTELPAFEDPKDEAIELVLNQTGVEVNCSLKLTNQTRRVPTLVYWEKDGKILRNDIIRGSLLSSTLIFSNSNATGATLKLFNVTHETQGNYECVAKNIKGEVRKAYKLFVDDGSGFRMKITVISGIILNVLGGIVGWLVWRHWDLRRNISRILSK